MVAQMLTLLTLEYVLTSLGQIADSDGKQRVEE
jgi:hypothetical protein